VPNALSYVSFVNIAPRGILVFEDAVVGTFGLAVRAGLLFPDTSRAVTDGFGFLAGFFAGLAGASIDPHASVIADTVARLTFLAAFARERLNGSNIFSPTCWGLRGEGVFAGSEDTVSDLRLSERLRLDRRPT
jgi:hypothetical protein